MNTLTLPALSCLLLLLVSAHQTTAISGAANEGRLSSPCERQMRWDKMQHCQQHLRSEMQVLMFPNSGNQACCLRECCEMLVEMDEECVCEAVQSLAEAETRRMTRQGQGQQGQMIHRVILRKAMQLPQRCGVRAQCSGQTSSSI